MSASKGHIVEEIEQINDDDETTLIDMFIKWDLEQVDETIVPESFVSTVSFCVYMMG